MNHQQEDMTKDMIKGSINQLDVLIPARGGSKGLVRKNALDFNNHPLIAWTIKNAMGSKCVSEVFVSTDCDEIASISEKFGAVVIRRPSSISCDTSSTEEAVEHFLNFAPDSKIETMCLLQCTSPIRRTNFIDDFFSLHASGGYNSSLSVFKSHRFFWKLDKFGQASATNYEPSARPRRQDFEKEKTIYEETGSGYIFSKKGFLQNKSRLFGRIGLFETMWAESFEIDTKSDFLVLEKIHKLFIEGQLDD
jgi:N-acylneuraminate cytidylyltransferase